MAKNRKRYTLEEVQNNQFYQLPKFLFEDEFAKMSNDARVLYSLLKDRHSVSIKNGWFNRKGEVYLIYSREEMCKMLNVSRPTVTKAIKELKNLGLIEEERLGRGQPNLIFLTAVTLDITKKEKIFTSRRKKSLHQEGKNFSPSNTNISKTKEEEEEKKNTRKKNSVDFKQNKTTDVLHYEEYETAALVFYRLFADVFDQQTQNILLSWIDIMVRKHGKDNVIYALERLAEQEKVDNVILWLQKAIQNSNKYPPKIGLKNPKFTKRAKKVKAEHYEDIERQKLYDALLMS